MLIILDSTSRTLKAKMSMNAMVTDCSVIVAYADNNGTTFTEGSMPTTMNGTTAVTILSAPASGVRRIVKSICVYNPDTDTHTTTIIFNDNTTEYPITRLTLAPGASWSSDDQTGVNVGGAVTDGDKGDISVSSGGTTWTIDNDAVTYAKIQNVTDARLLGRSAGSNGDAQEITVGTGLSLSAGSLTATATGVSDGDKGDITVSSSGATWTVDNGAITYAKIQNVTDARLLGRSSGTAGTAQEITVGSGLSLSQGATPTLTATGGSMVYPGAGIAVSNGTAWITPKNSPTGDVVGTSDSQALTNKTINGASNTISNINLASQVTGTLPIANGGTGQTTRQAAMDALAGAVTAGRYLRGDGTDVVLAALQAADLTGAVAVANGGTGLTSTPTNGQLDIGNGSGFTRATLTAGSNITITNGPGSITIASASGGGGALTNAISGFNLSWLSGTSIQVAQGFAYVPASSAVVELTAPTTVSATGLSSLTWYFVYLYSSGGTGAIELSSVTPTFYQNGASIKTGDSSRRTVGAFLTSSTGAVYQFYADENGSECTLSWYNVAKNAAPFRITVNGAAVASTNYQFALRTNSSNPYMVPTTIYKGVILAPTSNTAGGIGIGPTTVSSPVSGMPYFLHGISYAQVNNSFNTTYMLFPPSYVPVLPSATPELYTYITLGSTWNTTTNTFVAQTSAGIFMDITGFKMYR